MIDNLLKLIETKAIDSYRGEVDVIYDRGYDTVVISQGERIIVLNIEDLTDLVTVILNKLTTSRDNRSRYG